MTLRFENGFECFDEVLQEVKATIFRISQDPLDWIQPDWTIQLRHVLECYNVTTEEEEEDPRNVNIPKTKVHREVEGPQIENPDITVPLKTRQVNIGTEVELKFAKIWYYWDDDMVDKVVEFLREYQALFPTNF